MAMQPANFGGPGDGNTYPGDMGHGITGQDACLHTLTDIVGNEVDFKQLG